MWPVYVAGGRNVPVPHILVIKDGHTRYPLLKLTGVRSWLREIAYAAGIYPMSEGTTMLDGDLILYLQYPWQSVLLEAVLSKRVCDVNPLNMHERIALRDAMRSLRILRSQPVAHVASIP